MPFRLATSRCTRRWAFSRASNRRARRKPLRSNGNPGAATPLSAPGTRYDKETDMKHASSLACMGYESPMGTMLLAASDRGLAGVWFVGQRHGPDCSGWREDPSHPVLQAAATQLGE